MNRPNDTATQPEPVAAPALSAKRINGRAAAWLSLLRISNLPTVWTNVLAGGVLAAAASDQVALGTLLPITAAVVGASLCYLAGMIGNDWFDRRLDAKQRPDRPIPSGAVSARAAFLAMAVGLLVGIGLMIAVMPTLWYLPVALLASIVTYNLLHKKTAAAVLVMGMCRSLLVVIGGGLIAAGGPWQLPVVVMAATVGVYVTLLTVVARDEATAGASIARPIAAWCMVMLPGLLIAILWPVMTVDWTLVGAAVIGIVGATWLVRSAVYASGRADKLGPAIHGYLSGLCLIDAFAIAIVGYWPIAFVAAMCWLLTHLAQRQISGT